VSGARRAPSERPASSAGQPETAPAEGAQTSPARRAQASLPEEPLAPEPREASPSPARPQSYEEAAARVEEIIKRLDSGDASLNETLELVSEGKELIELCARQLAAVSGALEELRLDELVSRLEREASA
jgi:exodeoxyribonuclease VII small subunit